MHRERVYAQYITYSILLIAAKHFIKNKYYTCKLSTHLSIAGNVRIHYVPLKFIHVTGTLTTQVTFTATRATMIKHLFWYLNGILRQRFIDSITLKVSMQSGSLLIGQSSGVIFQLPFIYDYEFQIIEKSC